MPRARAVFVRQVHLWHRLSGAVTLAGLLLFAASGLLLNHPGLIPDHARHSEQAAPLPADLLAPLAAQSEGSHPLPAPLADWAAREFGIRVAGLPADWDRQEVFLDLPRPGGAAALILDRQTGAAVLERTSHGWLAYLADLHTGRAAGVAWRLFIDAVAIACVLFALTGLGILWAHAKNRPSTWPLTGLGLAAPVILILLVAHV